MDSSGARAMKQQRCPISSAQWASRGHLYAVFGNKEALFRLVLDRYKAKMRAI
jgi:hypothetical protein